MPARCRCAARSSRPIALMQRDFALRAAFDHYFPDVLGPLVPVAADFVPTDAVVAKVAAAMSANPAAYARAAVVLRRRRRRRRCPT